MSDHVQFDTYIPIGSKVIGKSLYLGACMSLSASLVKTGTVINYIYSFIHLGSQGRVSMCNLKQIGPLVQKL